VRAVADNLADVRDAIVTVLSHEGNHAGEVSTFGPTLEPFLDELVKDRNADVALYAGTRLDMQDPKQRREAASEFMAHLAEANNGRDLPFLRRVYAAIRAALRRLGFVVHFSDADLREIVAGIASYNRTGDDRVRAQLRERFGTPFLLRGEPGQRDNAGQRMSVRTRPDPRKTVTAYKLFRVDPRQPGKLFPLFVNANESADVGVWYDADVGPLTDQGKVRSKLGPLAYRPGWHAGDAPMATHIGEGGQPPTHRPANQVWAEVEMPADVDWQARANESAAPMRRESWFPSRHRSLIRSQRTDFTAIRPIPT
jgi:hypothetical protein